MYLRKLYTSPPLPVWEIKFHNGVNIIYGKKLRIEWGGENPINEKKKKSPNNNLGKSTLLDLIDFCLVSKFDEKSSKRLFHAHEKWVLLNTEVFLEFEIDRKIYTIKRWFTNPNNITLIDEDGESSYNTEGMKHILFFKIFQEANEYTEDTMIKDTYFRTIMRFFLKIDKKWKLAFDDPIKYDSNQELMQLIAVHFFLMWIKNTISVRNEEIQSEIKKINITLEAVGGFLKEKYWKDFLAWAEAHRNSISLKIDSDKDLLANFTLAGSYDDIISKINTFTATIKDLTTSINLSEERLEKYKFSISDQWIDNISATKVANIYKECNELLADSIKRTLTEAIEFRKTIIEGRKEFLTSEIESLAISIKNLREKRLSIEKDRAMYYQIINNPDWIKDLVQWYNQLEDKTKELAELNWKLWTYEDISDKKQDLATKINNINTEILDFSKNYLRDAQMEFLKKITELHNYIYPSEETDTIFSITPDIELPEKFKINVLPNKVFWKWRNHWRTLIYDLAILSNRVLENLSGPVFLTHDWIFDWMDKTQMIKTFSYINKLSEDHQIQYITTVNEEWLITEDFWDKADIQIFDTENLWWMLLIELNPDKKLFWKTF